MHIKPTGIWYDTLHQVTVSSKRDNCIYFPSKAEYGIYKYLTSAIYNTGIEIKVHPKVSVHGKSWRIDFCLVATKVSALYTLATICNTVNKTEFIKLPKLYIEYKGVQDKNFITKMTHFCIQSPTLASTVILISSNVGAFGCENTISKSIMLKPIVSADTFKTWFDSAILEFT